MIRNSQSKEAPEEQVNSRGHPDIPFIKDILSTPEGYSLDVENQFEPWEYEQLGSELKHFMEQLEPTPCERAVAQAWQGALQRPTDPRACASAGSCYPDNHTNGPQPIVPGTFEPLSQTSNIEHFDEASFPLSTEMLLAYSSMLVEVGPSAMHGLELKPADLSFLDMMHSFGHQQSPLLGSGADEVHRPQHHHPEHHPRHHHFIQPDATQQHQRYKHAAWPTENISGQQAPSSQSDGNRPILQNEPMNQSENDACAVLHTTQGFVTQHVKLHTQQVTQKSWAEQENQVFMLPEGYQSVMDLTDEDMSPWERVEQQSSDWSEWEQISGVEHSDRSDWEQVSVEHSDRSDGEQCSTDLEPTTSTSTSEQEEASATRTAPMAKRGRTNISHQRKLEVIAFCNANRHLTSHQQSKELGIVRTTMVNILSQQKAILMRPTATNTLTLQKELLRPSTTVASSRLHIMDLLLCAWIKELRDQYIPVPDEKVRWQAFAVHRMLSGLTNEPLPPCAFSNGWMDKFKVRMALKMEKADPLLFVKNDSDEIKELRHLLHRHALEDIYTCDVTSIFASPGCVLKHPKQAYRLQQYAPGNFGTQVNGAKDVQRVAFQDWLTTFARLVQRESLLLISEDTWEQVRGKLPGLRRVKVAVVPKHLNAWLPMRAGIAREFKSHINAINFERTLDPEKFSEGNVYNTAMHDIDSSVITDCFKRFSAAAHWSKKGRPRDIKSPDRPMRRGRSKDYDSAVVLTGAQERLKSIFLSAHKDAKTKGHVLLYYLNQDSDIGPSAFLCTMIERMHLRSDVEPYLNPSGLGIRKESWWSHVVITSGTQQADSTV
ncbi:unnamed protein product [Mortierella alpina]